MFIRNLLIRLKGMYVMHPNLLPKDRGANPIQHAIQNRETKTGVCLIEISKDKLQTTGKI
jgi:methionyl-tRNA formyltransferase